MRISVIIPALNEAEGIVCAVQRAWEAGADEVLVADGGSQDDTPRLAGDQRARVVLSEAGRAVQQNRGARQASGEVLVFQHADNWLASGALDQVRRSLEDRAVLGGAFCQRIAAEGRLYRWLEKGNAFRARRCSLPYGDQGLFLRTGVFWQLGGFAEVPLMEDVLLMRAFRRLSRPVLLPGPLYVSPRRWQQNGIVRQTARNWLLLAGLRAGVSPYRLAGFYRRHDR